jgi:hypothetical protein
MGFATEEGVLYCMSEYLNELEGRKENKEEGARLNCNKKNDSTKIQLISLR